MEPLFFSFFLVVFEFKNNQKEKQQKERARIMNPVLSPFFPFFEIKKKRDTKSTKNRSLV